MLKAKILVMLKIVGIFAIVTGIVLPARKILIYLLPPEGVLYFGKLLAGMWCLKFALVLNGLILFFFQTIQRYLWQNNGRMVSGQAIFPRIHKPLSGGEYIIFFIILIFAVILRLININQSLFSDEIVVQRMFISRGIPVILTYFPYTPHHIMYSLLAFFSQKIPIPIEIAYRLPAALASVGVVALAYFFARKIFTKFESAMIMFLNAVSFFAIAYSHMAKSYSITSLFVLIYLFALMMIIKDYQRFSGWFLLGLCLFILLYMHVYNGYLAIGLVFMFIIIILHTTRGKNVLLALCMKRLTAVLLYTGVLLFLCYSLQLPQVLEHFTIYRPTISTAMHISPNFFKAWLMHLTFCGEYRVVMFLCLLFALIGLISLLRRESNFAIIIFIPISILLFIVYLTKSVIFPRYVLFTLPFFLMSCVEGVALSGQFIAKQFGRRIVIITFTIIFTAATSTVLLRYYKIGHQNVKGASEFITAKALATDTIVSYGEARDLFPFYEKRVKAVKTIKELKEILTQATGDVYLLYGYEREVRHKEPEGNFIKNNFKPIRRFPGMSKDGIYHDEDIFVAVAIKQ